MVVQNDVFGLPGVEMNHVRAKTKGLLQTCRDSMEITCGSQGASVPPLSDTVTLGLSQVWCGTVSPVDTPVLPSDHPCIGASGLEHFPWMGNKDSSLGRIIIKLTWGGGGQEVSVHQCGDAPSTVPGTRSIPTKCKLCSFASPFLQSKYPLPELEHQKGGRGKSTGVNSGLTSEGKETAKLGKREKEGLRRAKGLLPIGTEGCLLWRQLILHHSLL